ncbi:DUF6445 family protein [Sphingomonas sp. UNC305MFCol5.2]|uniref:DUF6445 family protein n=1 Tax=Sphingomonas sp. UNC305MFCol5.2 TaxID=1449076 RepID=UPI0004A75975|nr:DUF6445 family protein [Sphingomonas sp. UNC305MFCol5.2]
MEQRSIRVDHVGLEREPVVVVENFAPDPEALIDAAEVLLFAPMGEYYPGIRAPVMPAYFEGLAPVLTPVMREVFGAQERIGFTRALYSIATTSPAELTLAQRIPHIDGVAEGMIAILHYLAREDQGGTAFYRHRSTGFETVDAARHRRYLDALRDDFTAHGEPEPAYIEGDTAIFEQIACYDAVFNRALIYRSSLLHCAMLPNHIALPGTAREGRLTVASFLRVQ